MRSKCVESVPVLVVTSSMLARVCWIETRICADALSKSLV